MGSRDSRRPASDLLLGLTHRRTSGELPLFLSLHFPICNVKDRTRIFLGSLPAPTCAMTHSSTNWLLSGGVTCVHFLWQKLPPCRGELGGGEGCPCQVGEQESKWPQRPPPLPAFAGPCPCLVLVTAAHASHAEALREWKSTGAEMVHPRPPTPIIKTQK